MSDLISRQAAIDEIKALYEWHDTVTEDRTIDHLKRLPSAEPDVPDTNVGDMISRQAAIDALQKEINKGIPPFDDVIGSIRCGVRLARNIIEDLPYAKPERKTSRWCYMLIDGSIMCLNCGTRYDWDSQAQYYKHCPNCGSRMLEEEEEEAQE